MVHVAFIEVRGPKRAFGTDRHIRFGGPKKFLLFRDQISDTLLKCIP
jgi:hypothetical protein